LNRKLLARLDGFSVAYVLKLAGLSAAAIGVSAALLRHNLHSGYGPQIGAAAAVIAGTSAAAFWVFHLNRMSGEVRERFKARFSR
jgi:hypothetical protein